MDIPRIFLLTLTFCFAASEKPTEKPTNMSLFPKPLAALIGSYTSDSAWYHSNKEASNKDYEKDEMNMKRNKKKIKHMAKDFMTDNEIETMLGFIDTIIVDVVYGCCLRNDGNLSNCQMPSAEDAFNKTGFPSGHMMDHLFHLAFHKAWEAYNIRQRWYPNDAKSDNRRAEAHLLELTSENTELVSITFHVGTVQNEQPVALAHSINDNKTDIAAQTKYSRSYSTTKQSSWSKSLSGTLGIAFTAKAGILGMGAETKYSASMTISSTEGGMTSTQEQYTNEFHCMAPKFTKVKCQSTVIVGEADVPYVMEYLMDGQYSFKVSGVWTGQMVNTGSHTTTIERRYDPKQLK